MKLAPDINKIISASMLRLRMKSPFFATLALFARVILTERISTAATNGEDIFINPDFVKSLPSSQVDGLLLHEVLHAALLHIPRCGARERMQWNIAADIVINGMIAQQQGFELPTGALRDLKLEHLSVEEIYELLLKQNQRYPNCEADLLYESSSDSASDDSGGILNKAKQAALEAHWRNAMEQAIAVARSSNTQGTIAAGLQRELGALKVAQLNWRSHLWRYLVRTPTDFTGFDRRFISQRLYLEALEGETVQVFVAVDTSGSIGDDELQLFLSEVRGIVHAYPHLKCQLYYAAADAYGPYNLTLESEIPKPEGGGGTSFVPFFEKVCQLADWHTQGVCVYLTDGYGTFPQQPPTLPVLWVVTPGGLDLEAFPFGEAVRLLSC
jgi:predicted metal-dependent peptidase